MLRELPLSTRSLRTGKRSVWSRWTKLVQDRRKQILVDEAHFLYRGGANLTALLPNPKGRFPLRPIRSRDQTMDYLGMRSSKSKLKASVHWRTRDLFWKLIQVQLFRDQNERQPIAMLEHAIVPVGATQFPEMETSLREDLPRL